MGQPLRTRGATAALGLALALGVLAACSDDDPEPRFDDPTSEAAPQSSSTPTVTESTTDATEPTEPTTSEPPEQETPAEFIERWLEVDKQMQNSGETDAFLALGRGCETCDNLASTVETYYGAGGTIRWEGAEVIRVSKYDPVRNEYLAVYDSGETRYRKKSGGPLQTLSGGRMKYVIQLERKGVSWLVLNADQLIG